MIKDTKPNPLPELKPGQQVLFLSPADNKSEYIQGTTLSLASTPRSYKIEANGRIYCCTRHQIPTINVDTPFSSQVPYSVKSLTSSPETATNPQHNIQVLQEIATELIITTLLQDHLFNQNKFVTTSQDHYLQEKNTFITGPSPKTM